MLSNCAMLADDIAIVAAASRAPNKIFLVDTKTPFFLLFCTSVN